jgi:hypothetical protein
MLFDTRAVLQFYHIGYSALQQFDTQDAVHFFQPPLNVFEPVSFNKAVNDQDGFPSTDAVHLHGLQQYSSLDQEFQDVFRDLQGHIDLDDK